MDDARAKLGLPRKNADLLARASPASPTTSAPAASSIYSGVCWAQRQKKWAAYIYQGGKKKCVRLLLSASRGLTPPSRRHLGYYEYEAEAGRAVEEDASARHA